VLPSILGDGSAENDFGFVRFTPGGALKFGRSVISHLTTNECRSGALRWSVRIDQNETV
jgi:hypothetical protein